MAEERSEERREERRPLRSPPRAIIELKRLKGAHPELASAIDVQLALLELQRRVQARIGIPTRRFDEETVRRHVADGRPLVRFEDIPIEWTEVRRMLRGTVDVLQHAGTLEIEPAEMLQILARDPDHFPVVVERWYTSSSGAANAPPPPQDPTGMLDQVLTLAMRPFMIRCAEVLLPQLELSGWTLPRCPLCGGDPEFAVITADGDRQLLCGRCTGAWTYPDSQCPFCSNDDRLRQTSFSSRDRLYRLTGCDVCLRYLKAFDTRHATRGVMLVVDTIATLPLDAAAVQRGYQM